MLGTAVELHLTYIFSHKLAATKSDKARISHDTNTIMLLGDQLW